MKKNFFFIVFTFVLCSFAFAQSTKIPQLVNFQAVARDATGTVKANQDVQVRLTVRDGSATGSSVYCALYETKTNDFGAFNIQLNRDATPCTANSPTFESILWEIGNKWVQIEYRFGIGAYTDLGATEVASTFYAFAAQSAEKVGFINTDNAQDGFVLAYDATNKIWKPRQLILSGISVVQPGTGISVNQTGNTVIVNNTGDTNPTDDITNATTAQGDVSGTFPTLSVDRIKGRAISNTAPTDGQVLKWNNSTQIWEPQSDEKGSGGSGDNWGNQVVQTTGSALLGNGTLGNPLLLSQQGASIGQVLKWDGMSWIPAQDLTGGGGGQTTVSVDPNGLEISGNPATGYIITNRGDTNPNDDITQNTNAGGDLTGTYPNPQIAPNAVGNTEIANGSINSDKLASMGANNGQVLKFNGTAWVPLNDQDLDAQTLTLVGNKLTISGSNTFVDLPTGATYFEGQGIDITPSNTISVNPSEVNASGDVSGPLNNLQIQSNTVGSNEIINGSITQADLGFTLPVSQWQNNGAKIFYNGGNVGIGINDPLAPLQVANTSTSNQAILGVGSITKGAGVAGLGDNFSAVPTNKMGVFGSSVIGLFGIGNTKNSTETGTGVWGLGQGENSIGIYGQAGTGNGAIAGFFSGSVLTFGSTANVTSSSVPRVLSTISSNGAGSITTFGNNGSTNVRLTTAGTSGNSGAVAVYGSNSAQTISSAALLATDTGNGELNIRASDGDLRCLNAVNTSGAGFIGTYGLGQSNTDLKLNASLGALDGFPNNGYISVRDNNSGSLGSTPKAAMLLDAAGHGRVFIRNQSGSELVEMGFSSNGSGYVAVNGNKFFRIEHPKDPSKEIWYACIEGPESAAYERGTAQLVNGTATVVFSEHFQAVSNPKTMTVMLTPLSSDSKGMAVIEKTSNGFIIKELFDGNGNYSFDWEVKCVRQGYENYQAVRPRASDMPLPADSPIQQMKLAEPDALPSGSGASYHKTMPKKD